MLSQDKGHAFAPDQWTRQDDKTFSIVDTMEDYRYSSYRLLCTGFEEHIIITLQILRWSLPLPAGLAGTELLQRVVADQQPI